MTTTPQAVARTIKSAGVATTPRGREGVHVTRSHNGACVDIDIEQPSHRRHLAELIAETLTAAGYAAERSDITSELGPLYDSIQFHVTRSA